LKRPANIWVFVAVAVACFVIGALLAGICTSFIWGRGHNNEEKEPIIRIERGSLLDKGTPDQRRRVVN
jgi:hypothetical protein